MLVAYVRDSLGRVVVGRRTQVGEEERLLLEGLAGKNFKLRDVNCRYMTGVPDESDYLNPPHEWHRDSPGEFCIAGDLDFVASTWRP